MREIHAIRVLAAVAVPVALRIVCGGDPGLPFIPDSADAGGDGLHGPPGTMRSTHRTRRCDRTRASSAVIARKSPARGRRHATRTAAAVALSRPRLITEASPEVRAKLVYFALDGGTHALDESLVAQMKAVYFVNAKDSAKGESHNASSMRSLHSAFHGSHLFTVNANGSGCNVGATWCLHDTLVTTRPHNPNMFDLADDYEQFGGARKVVTSYVDQAVADGVLVAEPPPLPATPATP